MSVAAEADRRVLGRGTSEADWQRWAGWRQRPTSATGLVPSRLVVVAPHPDDETLMAGGLICAVAAAGRPVLVIAVTAGDASHPGSARWPRSTLMAQRRFERSRALAALGSAQTLELAVPDGQVDRFQPEITDRISAALSPGDTVVTTWRYDGHPDHEATAAAVIAAGPSRLLQAPVWGWHWARPDQVPADPVLVELTSPLQRAKGTAIQQFRSQLEADPSTGAEPILPDWALLRWQRPYEVFFRD